MGTKVALGTPPATEVDGRAMGDEQARQSTPGILDPRRVRTVLH